VRCPKKPLRDAEVTDAPDLSVVIVSHGHAAMLPGCVSSLGPALEGITAEILVIDNLAEGGAAAALSGHAVRVMTNLAPLGFAANANVGARATTGRCLLFLNPDTQHRDGRLADALAFLEGKPQTGLVGCRLLNRDGTLQQSFRRFPSLAIPLARGLGADHWPWRPQWYRNALMETGHAAETPFPVDWVFGAFLLLRRADFVRLGGMDEGFRLYYEDVDLAWRMRRAGLRCWVFPSLRFLHEHQRSSARRPLSRVWRWHVASACRYFAKTLGRSLHPRRAALEKPSR
jgi:N-acetylglucosaminyl-diphospho-decaprenol L-rhamnosyltransferase